VGWAPAEFTLAGRGGARCPAGPIGPVWGAAFARARRAQARPTPTRAALTDRGASARKGEGESEGARGQREIGNSGRTHVVMHVREACAGCESQVCREPSVCCHPCGRCEP